MMTRQHTQIDYIYICSSIVFCVYPMIYGLSFYFFLSFKNHKTVKWNTYAPYECVRVRLNEKKQTEI